VPAINWDEQPSAIHEEPWLFRALRDIKCEITGVREKQSEHGEAIAEIRGEVKTLSSFVPRAKSPSDGVTKALLADRLDESKVRRQWWLHVGKTALKVAGGVLLIVLGALAHRRFG